MKEMIGTAEVDLPIKVIYLWESQSERSGIDPPYLHKDYDIIGFRFEKPDGSEIAVALTGIALDPEINRLVEFDMEAEIIAREEQDESRKHAEPDLDD